MSKWLQKKMKEKAELHRYYRKSGYQRKVSEEMRLAEEERKKAEPTPDPF